MINRHEYAALASAAARIWDLGAPRDAAIIDAGAFIGASTLALAEGLRRSSLAEADRHGRIWSYDLFRVIPAIANDSLKDQRLEVGDSFRYLYDETIHEYAEYVRTFEDDILEAPKPVGPIAILFLDVLWNWEMTVRLADDFYTLMPARRSLLIHQDFVYPFYPWIILSMSLLSQTFRFAKHIEAATVVFDVIRPYRPGALDDLRNVSTARALTFYDDFIDHLEGWAKGSVGLGKALFLAERGKSDNARRLAQEIARKYSRERRVTKHLPSVMSFIAKSAAGTAKPLGKVAAIEAGLAYEAPRIHN